MALSPTLLDGLPILLPLQSDDNRKQVFTHRSFYGRPTSLFEDPPEDPSPDNEFLEYIGDSILNMCSALLLKKMYPNLRVGPATKIRSLIVQNSNIATIATHYRLPALLRMHPSQAVALRASMHVQADLFEAYVGGLFVEHGMEKVKEWLFEVLEPYSKEAYETIRKEYVVTGGIQQSDAGEDAGAGAETGYLPYLNQICAQRGWSVEWQFLPGDTISNTTPQWAVECYVDKQLKGSARATKKQKAKHEAARQALNALGIQMPN